MSFEDEVRETIQKARAARVQHEQEGVDFESSWLAMREKAVWGIFHEAMRAFKAEQIAAHTELINGSIVLSAVYDNRNDRFRYSLTLRSDKEKRLVICSSNISEIENESFSLGHLTQDVIHRKIRQFADLIARGDAPRTPLAF
ncbi:MAG TPA: hypothetical protein VN493_26120 [Thermoanaerobaculia bacterium]|nr:hypothetical protein [Thermoanaerobaculia bacterium]